MVAGGSAASATYVSAWSEEAERSTVVTGNRPFQARTLGSDADLVLNQSLQSLIGFPSMRACLLPLFSACSLACADKLESGPTHSSVEEEVGFEPSGKFASKQLDGGVSETKVDAFDSESWQRFDLDTGLVATDEHVWDLEFSRYFIHLNGGVSGDAGVEAVALDEAFEAVTSAPGEGYTSDREDDDRDTNTEPDNPFNSPEHSWFDYNVAKHTLSPHPGTFVVRSSEGAYFKLAIDAYYDKAGTPSQLRFRWSELEAPGR